MVFKKFTYINAKPIVSPMVLSPVFGRIPKDINMTYMKNGPGVFHRYGITTVHPFDGEGYVSKIVIKNGEATYEGSMVETWQNKLEDVFNARLFKGIFGTGTTLPLSIPCMKHTCNTSVIPFTDHVYALSDGAFPCMVFRNKISTEFSKKQHWSHYTYDPIKNVYVCFSIRYSFGFSMKSIVSFFEYHMNGTLQSTVSITIDEFVYFHDFSITNSHYIFIHNPLRIQYKNALMYGLVHGIESDSTKSTHIIMVDRTNIEKGTYHKIQSDITGFTFHHAYAYDTNTYCDIYHIQYKTFCSVPSVYNIGTLWKTRIYLHTNTVKSTCVYDSFCEFPIYHNNKIYMTTNFMTMITMYDITHSTLSSLPCPGMYISEPAIYNDIYLCTIGYRDTKTYFIIYDISTTSLISIIELPDTTPIGLHGCLQKN